MAQQRIHDATLVKANKLKDSINNQRVIEGLKKLTTPDIIDEAISFLNSAHINELLRIKGNQK